MYDWAMNKLKLERAILFAKSSGNETEENIKAIYISYGGLLKNTPTKAVRVSNHGVQIDNGDEENEEKPLSALAKAAAKRKANIDNLPPLQDDNKIDS